MKTMNGPEEQPRSNALRKWGPLLAIVVVVAVVGGLLLLGGGDDDGEEAAGPSSTTPERVDPADRTLPEGVMTYSVAKARGEADDIDWGERCDTSEGVLALPLSPAPECFAPFEGDNGGDTETGVTADSIKVVVYLAQENDPILSFIYSQIGNNDTPDKVWQTYENFNQLLGTYMETYGRKVELVRYNATGDVTDAVAAASDAETIARDIKPFAVLGGPLLTEAFADILASNEILCISCAPATQPNDWYVERAPYVWDIQKNSDQNQQMVAEYVSKRLAGQKAVYGGDEVKDQPRRFGLIYLSPSQQAEELRQKFIDRLADEGVEVAETAAYSDPVALAGQAREILARMKSQGVTTVLFTGDPLAPQTLTENATEQGYFPEWVITGSSLVDTTIFGRTYDQQQWEHAFGPSNLFARISPDVAGSGYLHRWFFGVPPPAQQSALVLPNLQLLYAVIQGAGPGLSHQLFETVIFNGNVVQSSVISPQISWGDRGFWPETDYAGLDDQTEVWWDADATCQDEIGNDGTGCWAYVDGGERYLPGDWPEGQPELFDAEGSVVMYTELPDGITLPDYEPLEPTA